jgi:NCS1 family nucleobase:cation symporter-1
LITGIIGLLIRPWKLMADPSGYIFTWLVGYSALLGPVGGIMIADYFVCRRRTLDVTALYDPAGKYRFSRGISWVALAALLLGILPSLPGFLAEVHWIDGTGVPAFLIALYGYAWFVGFGVAFLSYLVLRRIAPNA